SSVISEDEFRKLVKESNSYLEIAKKLGKKSNRTETIRRKIKRLNIDTSHFSKTKSCPKKYTFEEILVENSPYNCCDLKKRLIKEKILEYKCVDCDNTGEWNGKP